MLANKIKASITLIVILFLLTSLTAISYAYSQYTINQDDSLFKISRRFDTSLAELTSLNNINNPNLIYPNQVLMLPDNSYQDQPSQSQTDYSNKVISVTNKPNKTKHTPQILKVLKKYDVQATFFLLGKLAQKNSQVVQQIKEDGHVIGNHSWSHADLTTLNEEELNQELTATTEEIEEIIDQTPILLRPPYGAISGELLTNLTDTNYKLVN
ncbi:polysaccharide deacetylase family protein [Halanaerobaculum tunisiense]